MSHNDHTVGGRVSEDVAEDLDELADELGKSKSALVREMVEEGLGRREHHIEPPDERGVPPFAILAFLNLGVATALIATERAVGGLAVGITGVFFATLWLLGADTVASEFASAVKTRVVSSLYDDRLVEDPETLVERLTYADVAGVGVLTVTVLLGLPVVVAAYLGVLTPALETIGGGGALAFAGLLVGLGYLGAGLIGVSAVATLALASAGVVGTPSDADADA